MITNHNSQSNHAYLQNQYRLHTRIYALSWLPLCLCPMVLTSLLAWHHLKQPNISFKLSTNSWNFFHDVFIFVTFCVASLSFFVASSICLLISCRFNARSCCCCCWSCLSSSPNPSWPSVITFGFSICSFATESDVPTGLVLLLSTLFCHCLDRVLIGLLWFCLLWCLPTTIKSSVPEGWCGCQQKCDRGHAAVGALCFARCCVLDTSFIAMKYLNFWAERTGRAWIVGDRK